jgi:hypothetical protein
MADLNILERLFGVLSGKDVVGDTLQQNETLRAEPTRRIQFDPTQGTSTGEAFDARNVPVDMGGPQGMLETARRIKGFASDDPGGFAAGLEAFQGGLTRDQRMMREYLER